MILLNGKTEKLGGNQEVFFYDKMQNNKASLNT